MKVSLFILLISIGIGNAQQASLDVPRVTRETLAADPPAPIEVESIPPPASLTPVFALTALQIGSAVADVEMTQHCIAIGTCREGNLFMPGGRAGQYAIKGAVIFSTTMMGYGFRRLGTKWAGRLWWIPQTGQAAASFYGASTGWKYK